MSDKMQKAGKIARYALFVLALLSTWWCIYLWQEYDALWRGGTLVRLLMLGVSIALIVLFMVGVFLRAEARIQLLLVAISSFVALYAVQAAMYIASSGNPRATVAKAQGAEYDARSKSRYIEESNRAGVAVAPAATPTFWVDSDGINYNGKQIFPLSGTAGQHQVMCNENGRWIRFLSDRYGFNNPDEIWKSPLQIVLIGDSFTHGVCVDRGDDIAGKLRKHDWRVANLGVTGNGPLIELATLSEFGRKLRPKIVFWFYYEENDLPDLRHEMGSPLLKQYLKDSQYSQDLMARQAEVNPAIEQFIRTSRPEPSRILRKLDRILSFLRFNVLGNWLYNEAGVLAANRLFSESGYRNELSRLGEILTMARQQTESWGGKLAFVYLPRWSRYAFSESNEANLRPQVLAIAEKAGLPIIDFHITLTAQSDPKAFFPFQLNGHYTPEGHELLARELKEWVAKNAPAIGR